MEGLITGAFAEFLKSNRDGLNAEFIEAKRERANLDPEAFKHLLRETVAPIVDATDRVMPTATREVASVLFGVGLDLLGQDFLGANSRYPFIVQGWKELLPNIPQHLAVAPPGVIRAITNALYNLTLVSNARPQEWIARMLALAPLASDTSTFLQAGQIAAWRAGLSHYRAGALDLCIRIPPPLARVALGLSASKESPSIETIVSRLAADPWLAPTAIKDQPGDKRALRIVARVGAFRGFGGLFQSPPFVTAMNDQLFAKDGNSVWLLVADCFGATFHRADGITPISGLEPFDLDRHGVVKLGELSQTFPDLDDWASAVATRTTLAVTTSLSYSILLVAAIEEG